MPQAQQLAPASLSDINSEGKTSEELQKTLDGYVNPEKDEG